ncbi:MAG: D-alanyl-D-alanine carboxypeptidase family protein [Clostridia bacterium]|nr:D-alanyl-D-alanine carboxypeptidase family protein [Clostridia bacterium]
MHRCLGCMREFGEEYDVCPHCGYIVGTEAASKNHLAPGTVLQDRYILGKALGQGGFGITYIAWDNKIGRAVAIKEYMPNALASRITGEKEISCYNEEARRQFDLGLAKTRKEAHALSQFDKLESVVKVYDCIEENGTAYIVMELLRGRTVKEIIAERGRLSFAQTMRIMTPVLGTLDAMHGVGMIHRDVAPDNIFVCEDGKIKLLDFGAARVVSDTDEKTLSVMLKAGYAPVEQYSSKAKQGAFTDVYAASATMYKMLTGETPPSSLDRLHASALDSVLILNPDAPIEIDNILRDGMRIDVDERVQTARQLLEMLQNTFPTTTAYDASSDGSTRRSHDFQMTIRRFVRRLHNKLLVTISDDSDDDAYDDADDNVDEDTVDDWNEHTRDVQELGHVVILLKDAEYEASCIPAPEEVMKPATPTSDELDGEDGGFTVHESFLLKHRIRSFVRRKHDKPFAASSEGEIINENDVTAEDDFDDGSKENTVSSSGMKSGAQMSKQEPDANSTPFKMNKGLLYIVAVVLVLLLLTIGSIVTHRLKQEDVQNTDALVKESVSEIVPLGSFADFNTSIAPAADMTESMTDGKDPNNTGSTNGAESAEYAYAYAGFSPKPANMNVAWNLLLVNRDYILPLDYAPELSEAAKGTGVHLDSRVSPHYQEMYDAAKQDGITLTPLSGYRRISTQTTNFEDKIKMYMDLGYSRAEATRYAAKIILPPGTSEHNAGLAMDIVSQDVDFEKTKAFAWLQKHAQDYGFILRYPKDKEDITKITYEPGHWRYVGKEDAVKIKQSGVCLEEYLGIV